MSKQENFVRFEGWLTYEQAKDLRHGDFTIDERKEIIEQAGLTPENKEYAMMYYCEKLTQREIADRKWVTEKSVQKRLKKIQARLIEVVPWIVPCIK